MQVLATLTILMDAWVEWDIAIRPCFLTWFLSRDCGLCYLLTSEKLPAGDASSYIAVAGRLAGRFAPSSSRLINWER